MEGKWDVIVIGGGPGGSAAAKRCLKHGLKTLLLEKLKLPRDKVCSGMILSRASQNLIREEFGDIPREVLATPPYLSGYMQHILGARTQKIEHQIPRAWRKSIDFWMNQKLREVGGELWENAQVTGIAETDGEYLVKLENDGVKQDLKARFVIGADGATSVVRRYLFPNYRMRYIQNYRECYQAAGMDLEPEYAHQFYYPQRAPYRFGVLFYGDVFTVMFVAPPEQLKAAVEEKKAVARQYGLSISKQKFLWKDGCLGAASQKDLLFGSFTPARGNVLLIGEAAGIGFPMLWEGMGPAIKSGLAAATAIADATKQGGTADGLYLTEMAGMLSVLKDAYSWVGRVKQAAAEGPQPMADSLRAGFLELFATPHW